jgi:DNA repair protein RadC
MSKPFDRIPEADRPREKLLAKGAAALSDQELLAVLLG